MVMRPVLAVGLLLGRTLYWTALLPTPVAPAVIIIQGSVVLVVQVVKDVTHTV